MLRRKKVHFIQPYSFNMICRTGLTENFLLKLLLSRRLVALKQIFAETLAYYYKIFVFVYVKSQCIFGKSSYLTGRVRVFQTHFTSIQVFQWIHSPHALLRTFHLTKCRNAAYSWLTPILFWGGYPPAPSRAVISFTDAMMAFEVQWGSGQPSWRVNSQLLF